MSESTVRSILRLVAIVTMLVGFILTTMSIFGLASASSLMHDTRQAAREAGIHLPDHSADLVLWSLASQVVIIGEGLLLYVLSPGLARRVVQ